MGVKKSAVCRSRPPPNGMNPASSRVSIPLTKLSSDPGASPLSACSRSPGANLEAQPAFVEYFVSLMRVRSSIAAEYTPALLPGSECPSPRLPSFPPLSCHSRESGNPLHQTPRASNHNRSMLAARLTSSSAAEVHDQATIGCALVLQPAALHTLAHRAFGNARRAGHFDLRQCRDSDGKRWKGRA